MYAISVIKQTLQKSSKHFISVYVLIKVLKRLTILSVLVVPLLPAFPGVLYQSLQFYFLPPSKPLPLQRSVLFITSDFKNNPAPLKLLIN